MVLFGLSMDYTVLILERAAEARRRGASAREAAAEALGATGATVTSAAIVMIAVFAIFATIPLVSFKQLGVGSCRRDRDRRHDRPRSGAARGAHRCSETAGCGRRERAPAWERSAGMRLAWLHSRSDMSEQDTSLPAIARAAAIPPLLALIALNLVIWALTGAGYFWPMWPAWAFLAIMAFHGVWIWGRRSPRAWASPTPRLCGRRRGCA